MMKNKKIISLHSTHSALSTPKGFTLIELAMVLVVLGLLIGLGASLIGPLMKQTRINESRDVVRAAREAVIGYAMQYKMLPATIAAAGGRNTDAWGHSLESYYYKDANLTGSNLCVTTPAYTIATVNDNRTTPATTLTNKVVVLLLSPGENGTNDTGAVSPFTVQEYSNTYDDIVEYIDIAFLREKICNAFRITTDSLPIGTVETAYSSTTLTATDGTTPYSWSVSGQTSGTFGCTNTCTGACNTAGTCSTGLNGICSFPITGSNIGLCLNSNSTAGTGVISGTPTTAGSYSFIVQAIDNTSMTVTKSLTITINPNNPVITTEFLNYGTYTPPAYSSVTLSATGGKSPYTWSTGQAQGACAAGSVQLVATSIGLCLNTTTGVISGTPNAGSPGTWSFTVTVTDNSGRTASKTLSIAINP